MTTAFVDTAGDDGAEGTREKPLRTIMRAHDVASERVRIYPGAYAELLRIRKPGLVIDSVEQPKDVRLTGTQIRIEATAIGAGFRRLRLLGSDVGPLMYADQSFIDECEVTNRSQAIGVHVTDYYGRIPSDVKITGCKIHSNGAMPATNFDHGIYLGQAIRPVVFKNWILNNADRGVQMYPGVVDALIDRNVIDGNGQGVIFGGNEAQTPSGCIVRRNVIANSRIRFNVETNYAAHHAPVECEVLFNQLWTPRADYYAVHSGMQPQLADVVTVGGNVVEAPAYRDRAAGDYRIGSRYAIAKWLRDLR